MRNAGAFVSELIQEKIRSLPPDLKLNTAKELMTGTVVLAFPFNKGIILGADRQVSWGLSKIARTNFRKIEQIGEFSAAAMCGAVSTCQLILEIYESIIGRIEMMLENELSLHIRTKIFGDLMRAFANKYEYVGANFIFAGLDPKEREGTLLAFSGYGTKLEPEKYHLTDGSGGAEADSSLIEYFSRGTPKKTSLETAMKVALKAILRAGQKDLGVGDPRLYSATLVIIDPKTGCRFVPDEEVRELIKKVVKEVRP